MPYLHAESQSPDPTYGRPVEQVGDRQQAATLYPQSLVRCHPQSDAVVRWGASLDLFSPPSPVTLTPDASGHAELIVDFHTELDAELVLRLDAPCRMNVMFWRGESVPEVEGWIRSEHPPTLTARHVSGPGGHVITLPLLGFRFVRIGFHDASGPVRIEQIAADSVWTFVKRDGDFQCSDALFQRVWQTSAYTARLCTRPDTYWDGIKRDRVGWFGDGRIIKEAADQVFFDPRPAESMLLSLPTDRWANGIPNYSFDAIAMLRAHVQRYGLGRECVRPAFEAVAKMLDWAQTTQVNDDGFIVRTDDQSYAFDTGFVDWSEFPLGGRHEELSWLQATFLSGLRHASAIARWVGDAARADEFDCRAERLAARIMERFWRDGVGFVHTLNHVGQPENPYHPNFAYRNWHTPRTYKENIRLGPSGPSRQANALAVLAGLGNAAQRQKMLAGVFGNASIPPVITPYFAWYEQNARALCGDRAGPLLHFRNYIGDMLVTEDAATVWEYYDPSVRDMRRLTSHLDIDFDWPTSLCHGWGAGAVPLATELLLGITATQPGYSAIELNPVLEIPWSYRATVPTPFGPIEVERDAGAESLPRYRVPKAINVTPHSTDPARQPHIERVD